MLVRIIISFLFFSDNCLGQFLEGVLRYDTLLIEASFVDDNRTLSSSFSIDVDGSINSSLVFHNFLNDSWQEEFVPNGFKPVKDVRPLSSLKVSENADFISFFEWSSIERDFLSFSVQAQPCLGLDLETLCTPNVTYNTIPDEDGDPCWGVEVVFQSLPAGCPCTYMNNISVEYDSYDLFGTLAATSTVGTFVLGPDGQFLSHSLAPSQYSTINRVTTGTSDTFVGDGESLIFDTLWKWYSTRVRVGIGLDCNGDGQEDCTISNESDELYTPCWQSSYHY